jgi:hypothetical protein
MIHRSHRQLVSGALCVLIALGVSACAPRVVDTSTEAVRPAPEIERIESPARVSVCPERYLSHITLLAHDELEGRDTGSDGIDLAAGYVAGQFAAAGLRPGGPNGTYFQEFTVPRGADLLDETELTVEGADIEPVLYTDFVAFGFSPEGYFDGNLVFVGYGITNLDQEHDDYAGIDVHDKVVLMLRREPPDFDPEGFTNHARFDTKVKLAAEHGAVAVLIANQDPGEDGIDGLMRFVRRGDPYDIPALHIKRDLADKLLAARGARSLTELQQRLDETGENVSIELEGMRLSGIVAYEEMVGRNVIGVLPATGPNADEHVVIGAHYDHVGIQGGRIYNGADDNASGTAGVIELAHTLAAAPQRERSVIFIAFSAEETGLHGSRHFVNDPIVPIESVVAMVNMDMIGRLNHDVEANMLSIQGLGTGASFAEIVSRCAEEAGIKYIGDESALGPSDHAPFYRAGVPALFFHTGMHRDLHQPTDDAEKINAEGAAEVLELVHHIAMGIINDEAAPQYAEVNKPAGLFRGAQGVVMGIMPDMEDDSEAKGWRVARVFPNGGAAKAGMKAGDRIIAIDGQPINDHSDYRVATADKKAGDVIEVQVLRAGEEIVLQVELSARGRRP